MKANELTSYWNTPDNSKLTPKQISIRLPIHVAAKIQALCDMYQQKSRTEIIGDLLTTALEELESSLPIYEDKSREIGYDHEYQQPEYMTYGPLVDFRNLKQKYLNELEKEAGLTGSDKD